MKTILLWDPRFPDRRPARLTVEDAVASAAVRAGVAAAANPAEAGALSAGGALDPTMLTEVVLQHGSGTATRRVFLPYSVVMVGAAAGVLASIGNPIPGGVTPTPTPTPSPGLTAFVYQPETAAYMATAASLGVPLHVNRARRLDRAVRRCKAAGSAWSKMAIIHLLGPEAAFKVNLKTGLSELTAVGAPTFVEDQYFTTGASTIYYESPTALTAARQNNHSWLLFTKTAAQATEVDGGARDSAGNGISVNVKATSGGAVFQSYSAAGSITTASADYGAGGWHGVHRDGPNSGRVSHHGIKTASFTTASVALLSEPKLRIGAVTGSAASTNRQIGAHIFGDFLTESEELEVCAALDDYMECVTYGSPFIQEYGIGDTVLNADIGISGLSVGALEAAYEGARQGLNVVLLGDESDETIWHLCPAVQYIDAKNPAHIKGLMRDLYTVANATIGRADTSSQANLSFSPRDLMRPIRRLFDPTKTGVVAGTSTSILPGRGGVQIVMCGGLDSVVKVGTAIAALKTKDGRTINCANQVEGTYAGDLVRLSGVTYRTACEAVTIGAVTEQNGGFLANYLPPQNAAAGTPLTVDPYVIPGDPNSGLINGVIPDFALPHNSKFELGIQPMATRLTASSSPARRAPFAIAGQPPRNYNLYAPFEKEARTFAAGAAAGVTFTFNPAVFKADLTSLGIMDWNNGDMRFGLDHPNSGIALALAGADYEKRKIAYNATYDRAQSYLYWLLFSGDPRIPASIVTALQGYGLDPRSHLDPGTGQPIMWPKPYRREPLYMMNNQPGGGAIAYAADLYGTDGTPQRISPNTAATGSYAADKHSITDVANAGSVKVQGAFYDANTGGSDSIFPVPVEVLMPNEAECSTMMVITAPSVSRFYYGSYRMDPTMGMAGQYAAHQIKQAKLAGTSVQRAPTANVRNAALNAGDNTPLTLGMAN